MLTFTELRNLLGVSQPQLTAWVAEGMPCAIQRRKKLFDPDKVADWLLASGYAEPPPSPSLPPPPQQICTTRKEAADVLGVSVRSFAEWMKYPDFPGSAGSPGRQDGYYPIAEITEWRDITFGTASGPGGENPRDDLTRTRNKRLLLDYERELENLIPLEEYERFITRTIHAAKAIFEPLDDEVIALLPDKIDTKTRRKIRELVGKLRDQILSTLAELVEGDQDEEETTGQ